MADEIISRLEKKLIPGLKSSIVFKEVQLFPQLWTNVLDFDFNMKLDF